jgi:hypothetical protein
MRPKLLHPLRDRPHERTARRARQRRAKHRRPEPRVVVLDNGPSPVSDLGAKLDPMAERVRLAGGPIDTAVYTCCCGYLFSAAVSTTVSCPHCGADQAW